MEAFKISAFEKINEWNKIKSNITLWILQNWEELTFCRLMFFHFHDHLGTRRGAGCLQFKVDGAG